ncbi:glycosyltransferase, partial [Aeromonas veronii]|uniref:glycosyltransferase n=1 Tax=Aeromonas veronii TaxID=654 RepID=UPI0038B496A3
MKNILVAITNFNNSKYIEEEIQSFLNQKIPYDYKLYIVVFDNASTDNSVDI